MTLIDSRPATMAAFAELARETATAIDLVAVDRRLGIKLEDEVACWFPPGQRAAAVAGYRRHYLRLAERLTTALPGAHEALAAVRALHLRTAVTTVRYCDIPGPHDKPGAAMTWGDLLAYCPAKPGAWQDEPWDGDVVAKVGGKIFAFLGSGGSGSSSVGVKCGTSRDAADEWLARYPDDELLEVIDASYAAVVSRLPKRDRPPGA